MLISILWLFLLARTCEGSIDHGGLGLDLTVQQLFPSDLGEEQQRYFGSSVDILGSLAIVGAPDQSSVYIFRRDEDDPGKAWLLERKFEGEPGSNFGASVAIVNEDLFAVGGPNFAGEEDENGETGFERGYVALISYREGTDWIETERLVTSVDGSHLGYTVVAQPTMDFLTTTMLDSVGGSGVLMYYKITDNSTGSLEFSSSVLETTQPFNNEITNLHYGLNMAVNREILVAVSRTGPCGRASVMRFDEPQWWRMETLIKCEHADDENDVLFGHGLAVGGTEFVAIGSPALRVQGGEEEEEGGGLLGGQGIVEVYAFNVTASDWQLNATITPPPASFFNASDPTSIGNSTVVALFGAAVSFPEPSALDVLCLVSAQSESQSEPRVDLRMFRYRFDTATLTWAATEPEAALSITSLGSLGVQEEGAMALLSASASTSMSMRSRVNETLVGLNDGAGALTREEGGLVFLAQEGGTPMPTRAPTTAHPTAAPTASPTFAATLSRSSVEFPMSERDYDSTLTREQVVSMILSTVVAAGTDALASVASADGGEEESGSDGDSQPQPQARALGSVFSFETITISSDLVDLYDHYYRQQYSNETDGEGKDEGVPDPSSTTVLVQALLEARCGASATAAALCFATIALTDPSNSTDGGQRRLDTSVPVEVTFQADSDEIFLLDGVAFDSPEFSGALRTALGMDEGSEPSTSVYLVESVVVLEILTELIMENVGPDGASLSLLDAIESIDADLYETTSFVLESIGMSNVTDLIEPATLDTCPPERTCAGHGTCHSDTGECACEAGFIGYNCDTPLVCVEGQPNRVGLACTCPFPHYGVRCHKTRTQSLECFESGTQ